MNTYRGAQQNYKANYETVVRLGKAVPTDDDTRSLLVQLDTSAKRGRRRVRHDQRLRRRRRHEGTPIAPVRSTPARSPRCRSLRLHRHVRIAGRFFARLERFVSLKGDKIAVNGRLVRIESLTLAPAEDGLARHVREIGASAYIVPETTESPRPRPAPTIDVDHDHDHDDRLDRRLDGGTEIR